MQRQPHRAAAEPLRTPATEPSPAGSTLTEPPSWPPRAGEVEVVHICHEHQVPLARAAARRACEALAFGNVALHEVVTTISELATNLCVHTTAGGELRLTPIEAEGVSGIEIVSEDRGPGIANVEQALQDGFSTSGGLGGGLPGARRLMDELYIRSEVGRGTTIVARKWRARRKAAF